MVENIYLVRHCETDWNIAGKTQGISDIPLNANGIAQAVMLAQSIKRLNLGAAAVVTSPLTRALQTSREIADALGVEMKIELLINEFAFGIMEGHNFRDFGERFKEDMKQWEKDPSKCQLPGAESFDSFEQRCGEFLNRVKEYPGDAVVVTHSMVIKQLTRMAAKADYTSFHKYACGNGDFIKLTYDSETGEFAVKKEHA